MLRLFFDTETSGLPPKTEAPDLSNCPHVVQLAAILCDQHYNELHSINTIINPQGAWKVDQKAAAVHGITTEVAERIGIPGIIAFGFFSNLAAMADEVVAHNIVFDSKLLRYEFTRLNKPTHHLKRPQICTMLATKPICKLPGRFNDYKWPKLEEAHQHLFNEGIENAHDALADVRACMRIHKWLINNGFAP